MFEQLRLYVLYESNTAIKIHYIKQPGLPKHLTTIIIKQALSVASLSTVCTSKLQCHILVGYKTFSQTNQVIWNILLIQHTHFTNKTVAYLIGLHVDSKLIKLYFHHFHQTCIRIIQKNFQSHNEVKVIQSDLLPTLAEKYRNWEPNG